MISAKFSTSYEAMKKRVQRLPKLIEDSADTFSKKDAVKLIEIFQEGIRDNSFGLEPLKDKTIQRKIREGKSKPTFPLYGDGDDENESYINMFRIRKIKKGYRVYARWAKHHEAPLQLRWLLDVHENGALIRHPNGAIIRIKPRPAFKKAYDRLLIEKLNKENADKVQKAMISLLKYGSENEFRKISDKGGLEKYDED